MLDCPVLIKLVAKYVRGRGRAGERERGRAGGRERDRKRENLGGKNVLDFPDVVLSRNSLEKVTSRVTQSVTVPNSMLLLNKNILFAFIHGWG